MLSRHSTGRHTEHPEWSCRLHLLMDHARRQGLRPKYDILRYTEICARAPGCRRYDMSVPLFVDRVSISGQQNNQQPIPGNAIASPVSARCLVPRRPRLRPALTGATRRAALGRSFRCLPGAGCRRHHHKRHLA